jgi:acyl carrier protein
MGPDVIDHVKGLPMTRRAEVLQKIVEFLDSDTELHLAKLDESQSLRGELGLDSVDLVGIIMRIEGEYRIRLTHAELEKITTVGSLLDVIELKIAEATAPTAPGAQNLAA